jgi:hypothetical protein
MDSGLKIGHHLLAVVLFGALAVQSTRAEEAASGANGAGAATAPAKASGSHQGSGGDAAGSGAIPANHASVDVGAGAKGEIGAGPQAEHGASPTGGAGAGRDGGADVKGATFRGAHAGGKDDGIGVNPIDTRMGLLSRRPTRRPGKIGEVKTMVRPAAPADVRTRHHVSAPGAIGGTARDAIGLRVAKRGGAQGPNAVANQGSAPAARISVLGTGIARNATGSLANAGTGAGGPQVAPRGAGPTGTTAAVNHAAVNGTGLTRPGYGPGVVGGPAKSVAGINGTTIRSKH